MWQAYQGRFPSQPENVAVSHLTVGHFPYDPGFNPYQRLFADALKAAGLNVLRIPNRKFFPIQRALSQPIDLMHMDWPESFYDGRNWLATRVKRAMYFGGLRKLKRFPLVWTVHNLVRHDRGGREDIEMVQRLVDCCDGIMVMSKAVEALFRETYRVSDRTRVVVVPHGHYIDAYPNTVSSERARELLKISVGSRVVLHFGRLQPYKGTDLLIHVFSRLARRGDVLLVAGPATDQHLVAHLKDLAARECPTGAEIRFDVRVVPVEETQNYYQVCDLVAMPFRSVLNSGSLVLAMSFGRCVVAPRVGGVPELVCPEGYFGYDVDDADGLFGALAVALQCDDLPARGRQSRDFVRRRNSWEEIGETLRLLYDEILPSGSRRS